MEQKIGIIIQARMGSTRLPGKVLLPFEGSTILGYIIEKLNYLRLEQVVATSDSDSEDELINYLNKNNIEYYRGEENDVLQRFIDAANFNLFTHIIRVCADSPFVDILLVEELLQKFQDNPDIDYLSFSYINKPTVLSHFGIFAELVSLKALKKVAKRFPMDLMYHEHVTIGVYSNPDGFKIRLYPIDERVCRYEGLRLTVDTQKDYENILRIADKYFEKPGIQNDFFTIAPKLIKDKELVEDMKLIIDQNKK